MSNSSSCTSTIRIRENPPTGITERLVAQRDMRATVVVDDMDDAVWKQYRSLPNMVYVIDRDGKVAYHATWTMAEKLDRLLETLPKS